MLKISPTLLLPLMMGLVIPTMGKIAPPPITKHPHVRGGFDPGIYLSPTSVTRTATLLPRIFPREGPSSSGLGSGSSSPIYGSSTSQSSSPVYFSPSPSPSTSTTKSPIQLAHHLLQSSSSQCNVPGGGCAVLNLTLEPCKSDTDVCQNEVTLAAMVCAECNANQDSFNQYNDYLRLCQVLGVANPSDTIRVLISDASGYNYAMSPHKGASGSSSGRSSTSSSSSGGGVVGLITQMPSDSGSTSYPSLTSSPVLSSSSASSPSGSNQQSPTADSSPRVAAGFLNHYEESDNTASPENPSALSSPSSGSGLNIALSSPTSPTPQVKGPSPLGPVALLATEMGGSNPIITASPSVINISDPNAGISGTNRTGALGVQYDLHTVTNTISTISRMTLSPSPTINRSEDDAGSTGAAEQRLEQSKLALNAAIGYFSYQIDSTCDDQCSTWKSLSNTCTQDLCICTDPGVRSASACSSCLGTTTHGQQYQRQISYYNFFTANCSTEVAGLNPSGSGASHLEYDIVAAATTRLSSSGAAVIGIKPNGTAAGATEAVVTVVKSGAKMSTTKLTIWLHLGCVIGGALGMGVVLL